MLLERIYLIFELPLALVWSALQPVHGFRLTVQHAHPQTNGILGS